MIRVTMYHRRRPNTSPRSAANTPHWQVNDEATKMIVNGSEYGMSTSAGGGGHSGEEFWAFTVKNMANRPAKNISSLDSQTIVPTLTMLGLFSECTRWLKKGAAVVTRRMMA